MKYKEYMVDVGTEKDYAADDIDSSMIKKIIEIFVIFVS
jgi:hypothetical protein